MLSLENKSSCNLPEIKCGKILVAAGSGGSEAEGVARKETNPEAGCLCCLHTHIARQHWLLWNCRKSSDLLSLEDTLETMKVLLGCTEGWLASGSHVVLHVINPNVSGVSTACNTG